jgi:hypothetical protein
MEIESITLKRSKENNFKISGVEKTPEEVSEKLLQFGGTCTAISFRENGAYSFAYTDSEGSEYLILSPSSEWKRKLTPAGDSMTAREQNDYTATDNEITVLLLRNDSEKKEEDQELIKEHLQKIMNTAPQQGMEIEFILKSLSKQASSRDVLQPLQKYAVEAFNSMREIAKITPDNSIQKVVSTITNILQEIFTNTDNFLPIFSGMYPEKIKIGGEQLRTLGLQDINSFDDTTKAQGVAYVDAMVKTLSQRLKAYYSHAPQAERNHWLQIAKNYGFQDTDEFIKEYSFNIWTTIAFHHSIELPQHENGFVPETVAKNTANTYLYFSDLTGINNFSGGTAFGTALRNTDNDKYFLDARTILTGILPTSLPPSLIQGDLRDIMANCFLQGRANNIDRCSGIVEVKSPAGIKTEVAPIHSTLRVRASTSLSKFISYLQENKDDAAKNHSRVSSLFTGARLECTDRNATPEILGGNLFSTAMQNITHLVGEIATAEGHTDVIQFMIDKEIISSSKAKEEIYQEYTSENIQKKRILAATGEIDQEKVQEFRRLIRFTEEYLKENTTQLSEHWQQIIKNAHQALNNINRLHLLTGNITDHHQDKIKEIRERMFTMTAVEKYEYFIKKKLGIYGLISYRNEEGKELISNEDIITIIREKFGDYLDNGMLNYRNKQGNKEKVELEDIKNNRGFLEIILGSFHAKRSIEQQSSNKQ